MDHHLTVLNTTSSRVSRGRPPGTSSSISSSSSASSTSRDVHTTTSSAGVDVSGVIGQLGATWAAHGPGRISVEQFQSEEELTILRAIIAREQCLDALLVLCCAFDQDPVEHGVQVLHKLLALRDLSLQVVDAHAFWRKKMVSARQFLWREANYVVQMAFDSDFLNKSQLVTSALGGIRLPRRNPFVTMGGLTQSVGSWTIERDMPNVAQDIVFLLTSLAMEEEERRNPKRVKLLTDAPEDPNVVVETMGRHIRLAEFFILQEEKVFGKSTASHSTTNATASANTNAVKKADRRLQELESKQLAHKHKNT